MQASKEVTSNRPIVTSSCSRPRMDLRSGIGLGVAGILGVRLPERAVPFVRRRYAAAETVRPTRCFVGRAAGGDLTYTLAWVLNVVGTPWRTHLVVGVPWFFYLPQTYTLAVGD